MKQMIVMWMFAGVVLAAEPALAGRSREELLSLLDAGQSTVGNRLDESTASGEEIKNAVDECLRAVDEARKGGLSDGTEVDLGFSTPNEELRFQKREQDGHYVTTVGDIAAFCRSASVRPKLVVLEQFLQRLVDWEMIDVNAKDHVARAESMVNDAKTCREQIEAARAAGASNDAELTLAKTGKDFVVREFKVKLGEVEAQICVPAAKRGQEALDAARKRFEAERAPYRKLLSGDKLRIYDASGKITFVGRGGGWLHDPAALAKSDVWFEVGLGLTPVDGWTDWTVRRYQFKGMKLIKGPTTKTGRVRGNWPQESAFK
jgi:hypothetical protein